MTKGYIDLQRNSKGAKRTRIRADFIGLINETNSGSMFVLVDGNQVYTDLNYEQALGEHNKAVDELVKLGVPDKSQMPKTMRAEANPEGYQPKEKSSDPASPPWDRTEDEEIPF